jgi:hypothetical protein
VRNGFDIWHKRERREMHKNFFSGTLKGRSHLGDGGQSVERECGNIS